MKVFERPCFLYLNIGCRIISKEDLEVKSLCCYNDSLSPK